MRLGLFTLLFSAVYNVHAFNDSLDKCRFSKLLTNTYKFESRVSFDEERLENSRATVVNGELVFTGGLVITGPNGLTKDEKEHYFQYVMDAHGNLYLKNSNHLEDAFGRRTFFHSSFLDGKPVAAAGEVRVVDGVATFNRGSGHYEPTLDHLNQLAGELLRQGLRPDRMAIANEVSSFETKELVDVSILKLNEEFEKIGSVSANQADKALRNLYKMYPGTLFRLLIKGTSNQRVLNRVVDFFLEMERKEMLSTEAQTFFGKFREGILVNALYDPSHSERKMKQLALAKDDTKGGIRDRFVKAIMMQDHHWRIDSDKRLPVLLNAFPKDTADRLVFAERLSDELERSIERKFSQCSCAAIDLWVEILTDPQKRIAVHLKKPSANTLGKLKTLASRRKDERDNPGRARRLYNLLRAL